MDFVILQSARTAITIALGIYLALDLWRLNRAGPAFAIQQMRIEPDAEKLLLLHGRPTGLQAWLFTRLGLEADARLELTEHDIRIERQSLKGFELFYAPTHDLSSSECEYYRAISFVMIAASLLIGGYLQLITAWQVDDPYQRQDALALAGTSTMLASVVALVAYWLFEISKRIIVSVETSGGEHKSIGLKRNVIDNVTVGLPESIKAIELLNLVILRATNQANVSSRRIREDLNDQRPS
jgi:hypothetical protein